MAKDKKKLLVSVKSSLAVLVFLLCSLVFSGTSESGEGFKTETTKSPITFRMAQSHFTFPNSNVIPLGSVSAVATRMGDMNSFPDLNGAITEAMDQAIASKGGDLLINVMVNSVLTTKMTTWEGKHMIRFFIDVEVQGTVAKMEIGKQLLK